MGLSPFISKELCHLAGLNEGTCLGELTTEHKEKAWIALNFIMDKVRAKEFSFNIYTDENSEQISFYCLDADYLQPFDKEQYADPGMLLDDYYSGADNKNKINQRVASLIKSMNTKIDRDRKKVEKQRNELLNAEDREKYKIYG